MASPHSDNEGQLPLDHEVQSSSRVEKEESVFPSQLFPQGEDTVRDEDDQEEEEVEEDQEEEELYSQTERGDTFTKPDQNAHAEREAQQGTSAQTFPLKADSGNQAHPPQMNLPEILMSPQLTSFLKNIFKTSFKENMEEYQASMAIEREKGSEVGTSARLASVSGAGPSSTQAQETRTNQGGSDGRPKPKGKVLPQDSKKGKNFTKRGSENTSSVLYTMSLGLASSDPDERGSEKRSSVLYTNARSSQEGLHAQKALRDARNQRVRRIGGKPDPHTPKGAAMREDEGSTKQKSAKRGSGHCEKTLKQGKTSKPKLSESNPNGASDTSSRSLFSPPVG